MSEGTPPTRPSPLERPVVRGIIALALLAAVTGGAFALGRGGGSTPSGDTTPVSVASAPAGTPPGASDAGLGPLDGRAPLVGQPAPDFALRDVDGNVVKLSDLHGKVVWVNFWATWCVPCKQELPEIQKIAAEKRSAGLRVLEVNWQESAATARAFFAANGISLPLLLDRSGAVYTQYKLSGLPDHFFIDRQGQLAAMYFGQLSETKMRQKLAAAGLP
ncbi:MAG: TlpA family protein disulfide reductase [Chloroflexota bacterium]|nr:TlpA family protein disulfide reductase [Chloroflexota bacterium]